MHATDDFPFFYTTYRETVYQYALRRMGDRAAAEDLVQDVFLAAWVNREQLPLLRRPAAWLHSLAHNRMVNQVQRRRVERRCLQARQATATHSENHFFRRHAEQAYLQAIHGLPRRQREVFRLLREEDCSRRDAACLLGISENTVKNHMATAVAQLRRRLPAGQY